MYLQIELYTFFGCFWNISVIKSTFWFGVFLFKFIWWFKPFKLICIDCCYVILFHFCPIYGGMLNACNSMVVDSSETYLYLCNCFVYKLKCLLFSCVCITFIALKPFRNHSLLICGIGLLYRCRSHCNLQLLISVFYFCL